jgi:hypothetical protein
MKAGKGHDRRAHKMGADELAGWLHIRHRGALGQVPDRRKRQSKRACRDRRLWAD